MDDWQQDWWQQLEKTASNVEKFFKDVDRAVESFAEEVTDTLEEFSEQIQDTLITDFDRYVEELVDFITDINSELDSDLWEDFENFTSDPDFVEVTNKTPTQDYHPACIGCSNYHGHSYNGEVLICGMHPYGWSEKNCPDWSQKRVNY